MLLYAVIILPILAGMVIWTIGRQLPEQVKLIHWMHSLGLLGTAGISAVLLYRAATGSRLIGMGGILDLDAAGEYLLLLINLTSGIAGTYSIRYINRAVQEGRFAASRVWQYYLGYQWLLGCMVSIALIADFGGLWIAIEIATLLSVILICFYGQQTSVQSASKYLIICALGAALALFGFIIMYYAAYPVLNAGSQELRFQLLLGVASKINLGLLKVSFVFVIVGLGIKAGLAPMSLWIPDAYTSAKSPISALLSSALLSSAMYGILRYYIVLQATELARFSSTLLIVFGVLSCLASAVFLFQAKGVKRMLTYSSIGHMGIVAAAVGIGGEPVLKGALLYLLLHAVVRTVLFCAAGDMDLIAERQGNTRAGRLLNFSRQPSVVYLIGGYALLGLPPFGIFVSEYSVIQGAVMLNQFFRAALLVILTTVMFAGDLSAFIRTAFSKRGSFLQAVGLRENLLLALPLAVLLVSAWYLPSWFQDLLSAAAGLFHPGKGA